MALAASRDLRQAERQVEQARIKKEETWKQYNVALLAMYNPTAGLYEPKPNMPDPTPAVYQTDFAWRRAKKQLEAKRDTVVRQVYEKYYAVFQAASALEVARRELEGATASLAASEARRKVGLESELSLSAARTQRAQAEAAVRDKEAKLEQAWQDLALLLGKPASWRAELTDPPSFAPLDVAEPEAEIARIVEESPTVWEAAEAVELTRNTYGMTNSYEYDRLSLDGAYDTLAAVREKTTQGLRSAYQAIKNLELSYATAKAAAENARNALRLRELMYQAGMATRAEVAQARAALAKAEDGLLTLAVQHELAKMAFFKPWTASGTAAAP
jgi:outer membrane protein TolC